MFVFGVESYWHALKLGGKATDENIKCQTNKSKEKRKKSKIPTTKLNCLKRNSANVSKVYITFSHWTKNLFYLW